MNTSYINCIRMPFICDDLNYIMLWHFPQEATFVRDHAMNENLMEIVT